MLEFKAGDKVRLIKRGRLGGEIEDWVDQAELDEDDIYVITSVDYTCMYGDRHYKVFITVPRGEFEGDDWYFHPDHFARIRLTNEERIQMRKETCSK